jgi:hypothetical protein
MLLDARPVEMSKGESEQQMEGFYGRQVYAEREVYDAGSSDERMMEGDGGGGDPEQAPKPTHHPTSKSPHISNT